MLASVVLSFSGNSAEAYEGMFTAAEPTLAAQSAKGQPSFRSRYVNVDLRKMLPAGNKQELAAGEIADFIPLNLFDDVLLRATRTKNARNPTGSLTWQGTINGKPDSLVILVVNEEKVYGIVEDPSVGSFSITPNQDGSHVILEIQADELLSGEKDYLIPEESEAELLPQSVAISNDDGSIIDVYVAYDQDASGGSVAPSDAANYAELFMAYTNQSYENSHIAQRVWLVGGVDGYDHTYSDLSTSLTAARNGSISGIHDKRNEYHADLVTFLTPYSGSSCSGLAYIQTQSSVSDFQDDAYSTMEACSFGQAIFAHELGHNMGSRHDWYIDSSTTPATIAHGYVDIFNNFRTIMAYGNRCSALGTQCPTIAYFSNPAISFNGAATGVASGTSSACSEGDALPSTECDADNKSNFDSKALVTAQFRDSRVTWTGNVSNDWHTAGNWNFNAGVPGSTSVVNRVPRSYDNVFIPSGLVNYPTITGTATARELVIVSGATLTMTGGTLTVGWSWEDDGGFSASGGEVIFAGPIGVTIESSSSFNDVQIGTGADSSEVSLNSDLDIDGDLHVRAGANFDPGSHTIYLAGNWSEDDATGFSSSGASTVIFNGSNQILNKVTDVSLLSEDFSAFDTVCCTSTLPTGWSTSDGSFYQGDLLVNNEGAANRWRNQTDGYLFTPALNLRAGVVYQVQYDVATRQNYSDGDGTLSAQTISVHLGTAQSPDSMTTVLSSETSETSTSYQTRIINNITVATNGTYYIGFRAQQSGDDYTTFDDISVTGIGNISFHNLTVASGTVSIGENVSVANDLQISFGGTFDLIDNKVTVEGAVTNNGGIKQTKTAANNTTTTFGQILTTSGDTAYSGVEITPSSGSMGSTEVTIFGNQNCAGTGIPANGVLRCFNITPSTDQTANVQFYFLSTESNSNSSPTVYLKNGNNWETQNTANGGDEAVMWAIGSGLTNYGIFALSSANLTVQVPFPFWSHGILGCLLLFAARWVRRN